MSQSITLTEYEFLHCKEKEQDSKHFIEKKTFEQIEEFVLADQDTSQFLKPVFKKPHGKVLQAQNFVGLIQMLDGTTIEILPKIHKKNHTPSGEEEQIKKSRDLVIKMLRTLRNSPFKISNFAHLKQTNMPLLEIFISMFLQELGALIQKGMCADYQGIENHQSPFLKGKLKIKEQIMYNSVNASRFAIEHDEFIHDILPNRLIKTTLQFLYKISKWTKNQQKIREYIFMFDEIQPCHDFKTGFESLVLHRGYAHYERSLAWCKIFLLGNSFTAYKGKSIAWALLFDMNVLFESYVAHWIRKTYPKCHNIKTQHQKFSLAYQNGKNKFLLKPDIVINDGRIIIDTKWKILNEQKHNSNISQNDIYQMYAYATKYQSQSETVKVYLVYPQTDCPPLDGYYFDDRRDPKLTLEIQFFDLENDTLSDDIKNANY